MFKHSSLFITALLVASPAIAETETLWPAGQVLECRDDVGNGEVTKYTTFYSPVENERGYFVRTVEILKGEIESVTVLTSSGLYRTSGKAVAYKPITHTTGAMVHEGKILHFHTDWYQGLSKEFLKMATKTDIQNMGLKEIISPDKVRINTNAGTLTCKSSKAF